MEKNVVPVFSLELEEYANRCEKLRSLVQGLGEINKILDQGGSC